jgi:transcriptional regulator with GAF, ATPase, and Fis domain
MRTLLVLFGPKQGLRVPLVGRLVLGCGADVDVQLDERAAGEHCCIDASGARILVQDLGSPTGTLVNGERITRPTPVGEGDEFAVGESLALISGDELSATNARYGGGTLLVTLHGRAATAVNPGSPISDVGRDGLRGMGELAARLAAAGSEEDSVTALLEAIEAELGCVNAMVLLRLWQTTFGTKECVVPLAMRGGDAVVSISRALLERAALASRGSLVEDAIGTRERRGGRSVELRRIRSVMVVPWGVDREKPRGFIYVDRDSERPFGAVELAWLEAAANLATLRLSRCAVAPSVVASAPVHVPVGKSAQLVTALGQATAAAREDAPVLVLGETGTGKEDVARLIHARGSRNRAPFVMVGCAAADEATLADALFGHERGVHGDGSARLGAFEAADGGVVFLDEVGDIPLSLQARLMRVIKERAVVRMGGGRPHPIDVRLVASSHRDLATDVRERIFRQDLHAHLSVAVITMPPLRDRIGDVPLLARLFHDRIARRLGFHPPGLTAEAEAALCTWEWPGNLRELAATIERALVLRDSHDPSPLDRDDILAALGHPMRASESAATPAEARPLFTEASAEIRRIESALRRARGAKSLASRLLGISRHMLDKKIAEHHIDMWAKG